ncbi:tol-pal system protein YbgF [Thioclava sp. FR2]|uniref:tol-pal system protein YbgF n=1 Tax=Thioclava sp. FR2 TaxID=3445780 RepID=UPI003EB83625
MRALVLSLGLGLAGVLAGPAAAQDQTLADIRAELVLLAGEFNALKAELVQSGGAGTGLAGGSALERMDTLEAELSRLTSKAEQIELRLNRVVTDGTNRIGDLEFRLCEVTPGCDIATLGTTPTLGGEAAIGSTDPNAAPPVVVGTPSPAAGGAELAVGEQADFDRAKGVLGQGDFRTAADLFATFTQSYPGSPLTQEAHYLRGEALSQTGDTANAARAYLEAFSGQPDGTFAADSLLKLGEALGQLGQTPEACVTLTEVGARFPGSMAATQASVAMNGLACQ